MVRKKTERKPKSLGEAVGFKNIFSNEKADFFLGIVLFLFAIYVTIALVSYFSTGQADQRESQTGRMAEPESRV